MRDLPVGNGSLLINFDKDYQIRDIYFPHVGQENHSEGFPFRFGIWADGEFTWTYDHGWKIELKYRDDSLITDVTLTNSLLQISLLCSDVVADHDNVFLRRITVRDLAGNPRQARIFLHHDFRIYENKVGDTAFYDPATLSLIHYKKHRYFLINTLPHFDEFATGRKAFHAQEGTWRDAEDGQLAGGVITEGSVDSTIAVHTPIEPNGSFEFYYWIAAGRSHLQVANVNRGVIETGPEELFEKSGSYWSDWLSKTKPDLSELSGSIRKLFRRSLLIARTQIDNDGAIVAANDHDVTDRATDHYSYLWPRDGAFVANAFDAAGHYDISRRFFSLCHEIVHERGYFLQKYNPDGTVGSGWHPFWDIRRKCEMLPIQQDETALVLWALAEHFKRTDDVALVRRLYRFLIVRCADHLLNYRDPRTGLPKPSWNLWEDRRGVHTFTCSTIVAGLRSAALFAQRFDEQERAERYRKAADEIVEAMRTHLYSSDHGRFLRALHADSDDRLWPDAAVDASLFGIFYFGCFDVDDPIVTSTMSAVEEKLGNNGIGGIARFEDDGYMRTAPDQPPNPWFICTLWLSEYYIARAKQVADLQPALRLIEWAAEHAMPSGVMSEQLSPSDGRPLSVSPLTWSHSTFVRTVLSYLERLHRLM